MAKFSGRGSRVSRDMTGLGGRPCHGGFRALCWGTRVPGLPLPAGYSEAPRATPRICPPVPRPVMARRSQPGRAGPAGGGNTPGDGTGQAAAGQGKWGGGRELDEGPPMTSDSPPWPDQAPVFLHGSWKLPVK